MIPPPVTAPPTRERSPRVWIATLIALGIGLVAVGSALAALGPGANAADRTAAIPNLLTGVASLAGGVGYWLGRRWGLYAYALSVAGHLLIHGAFFLSALGSGRLTSVSAVFLALVPAVSLVILGLMGRDQRRGSLS